MPDTRAPTVPQFTRRLGIETPEHLVLELELAGLGSRMAATVCDAGLLVLAFVLLGVGIQLLPTPTGGDAEGPWSTLAAIVLILTVFLLFWGYFRLLDQVLERLQGLEGTVRHRLTAELVARFAPRFPRRDPDPETFLVQLHSAELAKRRGRLAARRAQGVGRTSVAAERFVMQKREGWETFRALAARAERLGLKQLGAAEIPGFAAQYREVASDLARARTYGVDPRALEHLERGGSARHTALSGRRIGQRA